MKKFSSPYQYSSLSTTHLLLKLYKSFLVPTLQVFSCHLQFAVMIVQFRMTSPNPSITVIPPSYAYTIC
jgi:hypothetical protein